MDVSDNTGDVVEDFAKQLDKICLGSSLSPQQPENDHMDTCIHELSNNHDSDTKGDRNSDNDIDSDEENGDIPFGYAPLSQEESDDVDEENDIHAVHPNADLELSRMDMEPLKIPLDDDAPLTKETQELIKTIMNNIQLPDKAIPEWAKVVPESLWMPQVEKKP